MTAWAQATAGRYLDPSRLAQMLDALAAGDPEGIGNLVGHERLKPDVHRLRVEVGGRVARFVAKRTTPPAAARNRAVARRWLPAVGLADHGPPLVGEVAEHGGERVWQLYDDLGERDLRGCRVDRQSVTAVVQAVALVHGRFVGHGLLDDCRRHGTVVGAPLYVASVRGALHQLESLPMDAVQTSRVRGEVVARLRDRLRALRDEQPFRLRTVRERGGPSTLLHGDLWPTNTLACPADGGIHVRIVDWDKAGVGPVSYDLSTFLKRLPPRHRRWAFEVYAAAVGELGLRLPPPAVCNLLFDTAEHARLASCVFWAAAAIPRGHADWGFDELARVDGWFDALQPILPEEQTW